MHIDRLPLRLQHHGNYLIQHKLDLLRQRLLTHGGTSKLLVSHTANHLQEFYELKTEVFCVLLMLFIYGHLAHAVAENGVLLNQIQIGIFHQEFQGVFHIHVLFARSEVHCVNSL